MSKSKKTKRVLFIVLAFLMLSIVACSCAGPNLAQNTPRADGHICNFWDGLFHGLFADIAFIVSLFNPNIGIYDIHNNGGWYNFGFLVGIGIFFGSSGGAAASSRR